MSYAPQKPVVQRTISRITFRPSDIPVRAILRRDGISPQGYDSGGCTSGRNKVRKSASRCRMGRKKTARRFRAVECCDLNSPASRRSLRVATIFQTTGCTARRRTECRRGTRRTEACIRPPTSVPTTCRPDLHRMVFFYAWFLSFVVGPAASRAFFDFESIARSRPHTTTADTASRDAECSPPGTPEECQRRCQPAGSR